MLSEGIRHLMFMGIALDLIDDRIVKDLTPEERAANYLLQDCDENVRVSTACKLALKKMNSLAFIEDMDELKIYMHNDEDLHCYDFIAYSHI